MSYPKVLDEFATIARALEGMSLARCGDGEAKIGVGYGYSREPPNEKLRDEMQRVMRTPNGNCLCCIPTMDPLGPKYENWTRHAPRFINLCDPNRVYGSAFVSRPDSSPWIGNKDYAVFVQKLWLGKKAAVVCERKGSMFDTVRMGARKTQHIECPQQKAYAEIDRLEELCVQARADIVVLSAGPTATCLANRLASRRIHAIDLGSAGRFLARMLLA